MTLSEDQHAIKQFFRVPWKFQETFQTPRSNIAVPRFVATIISAIPLVKSGRMTLDSVIFDPKHLLALQSQYRLPPSCGKGFTFAADGKDEVETLLIATFSDVVDFIFVPKPTTFVVYADHDDYTTFYAMTRSNLNRVVKALSSTEFETVPGYSRNGRR